MTWFDITRYCIQNSNGRFMTLIRPWIHESTKAQAQAQTSRELSETHDSSLPFNTHVHSFYSSIQLEM